MLAINQNQKTLIEQRGAPIWDNLYSVRVPYIDTVPEHELRNFGILNMPGVNNQQNHFAETNVMINIDKMTDYYKRNVTISFNNNADTKVIYEIVNNYLKAWEIHISDGLNMRTAPVEDLILLDNFAQALFPVAQKFGAVNVVRTAIFNDVLGLGRSSLSKTGFMKPVVIPEPDKSHSRAAAFDKPIEHNSLAEIFANQKTYRV